MTDLSKHGLGPVAWLYTLGGGVVDVTNHRRDEGTLRALGYTETALYRADQVAEVVERLEAVMVALRDDLLRRARIAHDGSKIVSVSNGVWQNYNEALEGKKP